ncbi:MAG: glycosyltransferase [bacterium]
MINKVKDIFMQGISLCMIVKNEADMLGQCLDSIKDAVDEIVIVDTGSTDKTIEIAQLYGAGIVRTSWQDSFSKARNLSLENALYKWILWTDADDIFPAESVKKILTLKNLEPSRCYGFRVKCSDNMDVLGPTVNQIRMFPNRASHRFRYRVHEQILPSLEENGIGAEFTDITVIHKGYGCHSMRSKQERNKRLIEMDMKEFPDNHGILYGYANALMDLDDMRKALKYYKAVIGVIKKKEGEAATHEGALFHIADIYWELQDLVQCKEWLKKLLLQNPDYPQAIVLDGYLKERDGNLAEAEEAFLKVLNIKESETFIPVDFNQLKIRACSQLKSIYFKKGEYKKANLMLYSALCIKHGSTFSCHKMGEKILSEKTDKGSVQKAVELFTLGILVKEDEVWRDYIGLSSVYSLAGDKKHACAVLNRGLAACPRQADVFRELLGRKADSC